ncbi:hypothetical protein BCR42DRAFT_429683 [Absidia repens]|uniref:Uncharacterized protein n=1 Tax=Absidia repens TaxID=90262 RepID=A0A1X2HR88_9FUNG|nr:hypothetical protein BCR42DRAFT_429683 [Absidia repens]
MMIKHNGGWILYVKVRKIYFGTIDMKRKVGKTPLFVASSSLDQNSSANLSFVCMIS